MKFHLFRSKKALLERIRELEEQNKLLLSQSGAVENGKLPQCASYYCIKCVHSVMSGKVLIGCDRTINCEHFEANPDYLTEIGKYLDINRISRE
ncbi:MAG: hypothetical protein ACI4QZ_07235 [Eubacteriales bacterium]